jgi:hypothetical protein
MCESLKTYINDQTILFERYRQVPGDLENRQDIKRARIAIYELNERVDDRTDNYRVNLETALRYGLDISVLRPYSQDDASRGELPLLDIKDAVFDWLNSIDIASLTNLSLFSLTYEGSTGITRNDRFVTMTLTLLSRRNTEIQQSTNLG